MKIHTTMPDRLKPFFLEELEIAGRFFLMKDFRSSWYHLERAHIIGQIPRLVVGGVKSFVGEIPVWNTGGANVPPLKSMEIPAELKKIIEDNKWLT